MIMKLIGDNCFFDFMEIREGLGQKRVKSHIIEKFAIPYFETLVFGVEMRLLGT